MNENNTLTMNDLVETHTYKDPVMKTFEVHIEVIERHVITVEAENEEQAKEKGREHGVESCNAYAVNVESLSAKEQS
jgi:hypothetical protein